MTAPQRQEYKDAGITVLVSLFGWFAKPTSSNWDPTTTANMMAAWVKANGVDGIDVDYEVGGSIRQATPTNPLVGYCGHGRGKS